MQIDVALDAREIQDTGQMERVIHIQMNPEQRFVGHRIQILIEFLIIFICIRCPEQRFVGHRNVDYL